MLNVEVKNAEVLIKQVKAKATGKEITFREQELWVDLGQAYPVRIIHGLGDNGVPFPVGRYVLGKDAFVVSRFGNLEVDTRKLQPLKVQAAAPSKVA